MSRFLIYFISAVLLSIVALQASSLVPGVSAQYSKTCEPRCKSFDKLTLAPLESSACWSDCYQKECLVAECGAEPVDQTPIVNPDGTTSTPPAVVAYRMCKDACSTWQCSRTCQPAFFGAVACQASCDKKSKQQHQEQSGAVVPKPPQPQPQPQPQPPAEPQPPVDGQGGNGDGDDEEGWGFDWPFAATEGQQGLTGSLTGNEETSTVTGYTLEKPADVLKPEVPAGVYRVQYAGPRNLIGLRSTRHLVFVKLGPTSKHPSSVVMAYRYACASSSLTKCSFGTDGKLEKQQVNAWKGGDESSVERIDGDFTMNLIDEDGSANVDFALDAIDWINREWARTSGNRYSRRVNDKKYAKFLIERLTTARNVEFADVADVAADGMIMG